MSRKERCVDCHKSLYGLYQANKENRSKPILRAFWCENCQTIFNLEQYVLKNIHYKKFNSK